MVCTTLEYDLQAKFEYLARKVEALEFKNSGQLKSVQNIVCRICETNKHAANNYLILPSFKECLHEKAHALNSSKDLNITHAHKQRHHEEMGAYIS